MKFFKKLFTTALVAATAIGMNAASLCLGPCGGEIATTGIGKVGRSTVSAAIKLTPDDLAPFIGGEIKAIRVGLVMADGITDLEGWMRTELDGENTESATFAEPVDGWNQAEVDGGIVIDGTPFYVGYSFYQTKMRKCISAVGKNRSEGLWIAKNGTWSEVKDGLLSVELVVSREDFPEKDLQIVSFTFGAPVEAGNAQTGILEVRNAAMSDIEGFKLTATAAGVEIKSAEFTETLVPQQRQKIEITVPADQLPADQLVDVVATVEVEGDDLLDNNTFTAYAAAYSESLPRRVLIEEFTSEKCPNCPRAINTLNQAHDAYGEQLNIVAHHVGYYDDWLTVAEDKNYCWFYNDGGSTYAPAVMLDRTAVEGSKTPVRSIGYFNTFEGELQAAIAIPTFVQLAGNAQFDADTRELTATVEVDALPVFQAVNAAPRLTVFIIEDNIPHHSQAGISSSTFEHKHVYRKCLTGIWGDEIEIVDNKATRTLNYILPEDWKAENVKVTAFLSNYNNDDVNDCRVYNSVEFAADPTAIGSIATDAAEVSRTYFDLNGRQVAEPAQGGIYIQVVRHADGTTTRSKVVL